MVCADDYDVFAVSETWLSKNISSDVVKISHYSFFRQDRGSRGGGVGIYIKNKPPSSNLNECSPVLDDMIPSYLSQFNGTIILGDIMLLPHNTVVSFFNNYGFTQLVSSPTRITDLTSSLLDLIFVNQPFLIKSCHTLDSAGVSDHKIVALDYEVPASTRRQKFVTVRDFSSFNETVFLEDLRSMHLDDIFFMSSIDQKVEYLTEILIKLYDLHAPVKSLRVRKPAAPWLTETNF
nr:unnamed protein product [Callosobruchus analis]